MNVIEKLRAFVLVCAVFVGAIGCAPMQAWTAADFSALARTYGPAVVNIGVVNDTDSSRISARALRGQDRIEDSSLGSGFIVSGDGYILTNAHVVSRGTQISVKLTDRREFRAKLIGIDPLSDIALLKIDAQALPTVKIGNPATTSVGDWAVAIGSPYGFSNSVTAGIVSAKGRVLPGADYMPFLQTDVPVNPGNSGGPLFNLRGEVIGINSRIYSRTGGYQGLSFAIPIDVAMRIRTQLQEKGVVTRGRIGVAVQEINQGLAESFRLDRPAGALVSYVQPGGAADRASIKSGDVILRVQGAEVLESADALGMIADMTPGQTATLSIWRNRQPLQIEVTVDRLESAQAPTTQAPTTQAVERSPSLGLVVRPLLLQERQVLRIEAGLLVQRVNQAAARAGVNAGDVIIALNGQPVATLEALAEQVRASDGTAALLLQRGGTRLFVPIELPRAAPHEADD